MKKAKSAIKYGMETLKLSPDELFKLIESSKGYDGEDYSRWLAGKIIEVAEADGVQFSQLLVKKFNIVNELLEEVSENSVVRDEFLDIFKSALHKDLYSVDFDGLGEVLDIDWYNGLDVDTENSFFVMEKLPVEIREKILENEKFSLLCRLSLDDANKKTDLFADAKYQGVQLFSKGAMLLYRLCNMVSVFNISNMKIGIIVPVKFFYDEENKGIIDFTLSHFKICEGLSIKSVEMSSDAFNAGDMAFITLQQKVDDDDEQDGIVLTSITLDDTELSGYREVDSKRYSKSSQYMLNRITERSVELVDDVPVIDGSGKVVGVGKGLSDALGYLNINGSISLSTLPEVDKQNIAITRDNIKDIIAYYGVTVAREVEWGYSNDIHCLMDGRVGYEELLYNCLPLFLFDYNTILKAYGSFNVDGNEYTVQNRLDVLNSSVIAELLDIGVPYFTFEAKELFNICKDFIEFTKEKEGIDDKSFQELRERSDNSDLNNLYEVRLSNLKELINGMSKKFL